MNFKKCFSWNFIVSMYRLWKFKIVGYNETIKFTTYNFDNFNLKTVVKFFPSGWFKQVADISGRERCWEKKLKTVQWKNMTVRTYLSIPVQIKSKNLYFLSTKHLNKQFRKHYKQRYQRLTVPIIVWLKWTYKILYLL